MPLSESIADDLDKQELKKQFLAQLIDLRQNYSDDLPPTTLSSEDPDYQKYKCRGNFWHGVSGIIDNALSAGLIEDSEQAARAQTHLTKIGSQDFSCALTASDIEDINEILDSMIQLLS